jgi:hypothetical protein
VVGDIEMSITHVIQARPPDQHTHKQVLLYDPGSLRSSSPAADNGAGPGEALKAWRGIDHFIPRRPVPAALVNFLLGWSLVRNNVRQELIESSH